MPAPTAPLKQPADAAPPASIPLPDAGSDEDFALEGMNQLPEDASAIQPPATVGGDGEMDIDEENKPRFAPIQNLDPTNHIQSRKVPVPPHRFTPLKNNWPKIYPPLVEHLKLQVRMNVKNKRVELRTSPKFTTDPGALQKGEDFIRAFCLGFEVDDAIALLRLDDLFIETFEIKDVKTLQGDHLSRAIGRLAGHQGKTKFAIENTSRTRIILADSKVHILGAYKNIKIARESVVSLILGKPPGKVYNNLRTVSSRMKERF
ncbi:eukaryotic type KH-domain (KH-domain type I) [Xylariaceae sp. FL0804]|nr:eukaryotic type KH-domain (KH-domain type I) [Xylariaceae sp. FL0804]